MTDSIYKNNIEGSQLGWKLGITIIVFLINPLIGLILSVLIVIHSDDDYNVNKPEILLFLITTAVWISLINITKTISGDQGAYTRIFLKIPQEEFYDAIFNAWGGSGKEPAFSFLSWLLYWITGGSVRLYYFILSFLIYFTHFLATYLLFRKANIPKGALICGVLVLTFFTQYFVMTLQVIRQMLASGIIIYAIVYRSVYEKNNWFLLMLAVLIHTSAAFLAGLSLIPWFYSLLNKKRIIIICVCSSIFIVFNGFIGSVLGGSGIDAVDYGLSMYSKIGYSDESSGIKISTMLIVFIPLALSSFLILRRLYKKEIAYEPENTFMNNNNTLYNEKSLYPIAYLCILLIVFVLSFTKSPLIQYRFFYYSYSFLPLLLPLIVKSSPNNKIYWSGISVFFIIRFFLTHNTSGWTYLPVIDMFSETIYYYWTGNFHWMYLL